MGALAAITYGQKMTDVLQTYGALQFETGGAHLWHIGPEGAEDEGELRDPMQWNFNSSFDERISEIGASLDDTYDPVERTALATEAVLIAIDQAFEIVMPNADAYNFWQPWVRGYSGEDHVRMHDTRDIYAYLWMDDDYR